MHTGVINVVDAVAYYRVHGSSLGDCSCRSARSRWTCCARSCIRHDVVYHADYAPVREAAKRREYRPPIRAVRRIASRAAQHRSLRPERERQHAATDWGDMVKQLPGVLAVPSDLLSDEGLAVGHEAPRRCQRPGTRDRESRMIDGRRR